MRIYNQKVESSTPASATVTLSLDKRSRSRLRVTLSDGSDAGIQLARGESLSPHDKLVSIASIDGSEETPHVIEVLPSAESVSVVRCEDRHQFARACYHLGNRHVQLQIDDGKLAYLHDHVLDEMLEGLGFTVTCEQATFAPEAGAYGGGHHHGHEHDDHGHGHGHSHDHDHTHPDS